jgi:hypothetical protein
MARLAPPGSLLFAVEGADVGRCLRVAIARLLRAGFSPVVAVNSDGPTLPARYIEQAVERLSGSDVVLGPAEDGGYYLVGVRQEQPGLFANIEWSSPRVRAQTLERAAALGLNVAELPAWYDIDTPAEFERLRAELAARPPGIATCTRAFLARH